MIPTLVPVGALAGAKSRLRPVLGEATERLVLAMLGDVLEALRATPGLDPLAVVTPDPAVGAAAREAGAEPLVRPDPDLNAALVGGAADLAGDPAEGLLIVQGDVPGLLPDELATLLEAAPEVGVALAPSRDGGTSALLRRPAAVIAPAFGPHSAKAHREAAAAAGVACREVTLPSIAVDVDEREDLVALLAGPATAARTRALLRAVGWSPA